MYYQKFAAPGRFDTAEVVFIKRMLQKHLPEAVRSQIIDRLFSEFVSEDEEAFARELYMDIDQIRCMRKHGMFFGGHGAGHFWMDSLTPEIQEKEVDATVGFLEEIGVDSDRRVFSYPYGGHNESLSGILQKRGFQIGLTVKPEIASLDIHNPLALPRLDTNDLPR
jgi:peptidoglycan/xylan/chitin deacetylase (PgdA/CDA1 family)